MENLLICTLDTENVTIKSGKKKNTLHKATGYSQIYIAWRSSLVNNIQKATKEFVEMLAQLSAVKTNVMNCTHEYSKAH